MKAIGYFFERAYGSRYNPLHRSGILAIALLSLVIVTGVYLLLFYKLSAPYESILNIQSQVYVGRWVRSLHRYASDAALCVVVYHVLKMWLEGKSWGPRILAWISGVILLGSFFVSGWTGYVMVWDQFGQTLAIEGAKIMDRLPIFTEPISRSFNGVSSIPSSFFFMNLFLHVALPLGMIFGIWIHTSRLARTRWWPEQNVFIFFSAALFLLSIALPAPVVEKANLLVFPGKIPIDWFFGFWLPLHWYFSPWASLIVGGIFWLGLSAVPFFTQPKLQTQKPKSKNDESKCEGCEQCVKDCPFDAIEMTARTEGQGSALVARVSPSRCVSCGICAASCSQFSIGPPGRTGKEQFAWIKALKTDTAPSKVLSILCATNPAAANFKRYLEKTHQRLQKYDCVGSVHAGAITALLHDHSGVFILGCGRACTCREGHSHLIERLEGRREPTLPTRINKNQICVVDCTVPGNELQMAYENFCRSIGSETKNSSQPQKISLWTGLRWSGILITLVFCALVFLGTRFPGGISRTDSCLRLTWRMPLKVSQSCHKLTPEELASKPMHMRVTEECKSTPALYELKITVDGTLVQTKFIEQKGVHGDAPLSVFEELFLSPGKHQIGITFSPQRDPEHALKFYEIKFQEQFREREIILVSYDSTRQELVTSK